MDSFLRLYRIYRTVSRSWVARQIYKRATFGWKVGLWIGVLGFLVFAVSQFYYRPMGAHFAAMLLSACAWGFCFDRARRSVFAEEYRLYPERINYFQRDYQYLRYLEFRSRLQSGPYVGDIGDAIDFLGRHIETDSQNAISSHPLMAVLIGTLLSVLGAAAGQWQAKYIVYTLLGLLVTMYFSAMVLGMLQTKQADLREFKRFLLWAADEPNES
ncbi:hypothetical protein GCM10007320_33290 [Pseudorhodoferax aquiterrae]|uniref:Uncharacterized protein n=1 Tax=Pseudorhodoferax aquiterrae TaxID=747304 RepID=A0ABQ3G4P2_9BURK|nr:hypothetical protein [Pseudorhodoferax aquiterrae]GHC87071.1 hypothetical protein GCM10007320_33290 [Pseudorhodoferax aquiterrae]